MRRTLTLAAAGVVALAGCGGGGAGGTGGGPAVTVAAGKPLAVNATEYRFSPKNVVVHSASKGPTSVEIVLRNAGAQAHDLHVTRGGRDLGGTAIFGPGQTHSARLTLRRGTYQFECTVGDHAGLGMKGTLTVK